MPVCRAAVSRRRLTLACWRLAAAARSGGGFITRRAARSGGGASRAGACRRRRNLHACRLRAFSANASACACRRCRRRA